MLIEVIVEGTYSSPFRDDVNRDINDTFANPYDLMMTYATLRGNFDMAMLFWEFTRYYSFAKLFLILLSRV